jgi:hypothetical protein
MEFKLQRVYVGEEGAFGVLSKNNEPPFAVTVERTFLPDHEILIPFGTHKCIRTTYNKGGYPSYEILVDGHSEVKFHKGNKESHSEGCILVAEYFHTFKDMQQGIANSAGGFAEFMDHTCSVDEFMLLVC